MENKDLPAYPQSVAANEVGIWLARDANVTDDRQVTGLTKREYFAVKALQGLLANPASGNDVNAILCCVTDAVRSADFLLSELSKP